MKKLALIAGLLAMIPCAIPATAQDKEPKSEEAKVRKARKEDHTVRQVTPDPKKSPAKHADNLSKNVNHEMKRTGKHITGALGLRKHHKKHNSD